MHLSEKLRRMAPSLTKQITNYRNVRKTLAEFLPVGLKEIRFHFGFLTWCYSASCAGIWYVQFSRLGKSGALLTCSMAGKMKAWKALEIPLSAGLQSEPVRLPTCGRTSPQPAFGPVALLLVFPMFSVCVMLLRFSIFAMAARHESAPFSASTPETAFITKAATFDKCKRTSKLHRLFPLKANPVREYVSGKREAVAPCSLILVNFGISTLREGPMR